MGKRDITEKSIEAAMRSAPTRAGLRAVGQSIARRAESLGSSEGIDPSIRTEEGTRPKGRPYFRVLADADQEWGNSNTARRRILGRAAEGH